MYCKNTQIYHPLAQEHSLGLALMLLVFLNTIKDCYIRPVSLCPWITQNIWHSCADCLLVHTVLMLFNAFSACWEYTKTCLCIVIEIENLPKVKKKYSALKCTLPFMSWLLVLIIKPFNIYYWHIVINYCMYLQCSVQCHFGNTHNYYMSINT